MPKVMIVSNALITKPIDSSFNMSGISSALLGHKSIVSRLSGRHGRARLNKSLATGAFVYSFQ